jgi:polar amino acid transport system substrate-binding protein
MRSKKGELIGFEIDVAKKVAEDMGVNVEFVPTAFDGIIPALLAAKFDIIMTGIFVYSPWNLQVNFTNPYNWGGMTMVANKELTKNFKSNEEFNNSNVTITLRRGNQDGLTVIKKRFPKANVRQFDDDAPAIQDVINGSAHAFITAEPKPTNYVRDYPKVLYKPFGDEYLMRNPSAFALRKGDYDTINWLNNWIILNTESGWLQERHDYWFKTQDWKEFVQE